MARFRIKYQQNNVRLQLERSLLSAMLASLREASILNSVFIK